MLLILYAVLLFLVHLYGELIILELWFAPGEYWCQLIACFIFTSKSLENSVLKGGHYILNLLMVHDDVEVNEQF